uniref:hypothetical protein n=1 Tax=Acetatifactor sp. TaxID=1872090 RepID=UPI00405757F1
MSEKNIDEKYDLEMDPNAGLHRVYDYLPYSHWRIKQILRDYYGARLVCVRAYKEGRYPGYKQRYYIYDIATGKLIRKDIRLDELRRLFAHEDFPLEEDNGRNPKAAQFMAIVNAIAEEQAKEKS